MRVSRQKREFVSASLLPSWGSVTVRAPSLYWALTVSGDDKASEMHLPGACQNYKTAADALIERMAGAAQHVSDFVPHEFFHPGAGGAEVFARVKLLRIFGEH